MSSLQNTMQQHHTHTEMGTGVEIRGRTQDANEDGSGDAKESSIGDENRAMVETGSGMKTGLGRMEERRRSARNRTRVADAVRHIHSAHVIISADREGHLRAPDSSVCKVRCLYTRIAPRA